LRHGGDTGLDPRAKAEVELDVGLRAGVGIPEAAGFEERRGDRALPRQQVLQARQRRQCGLA
jgi:hypothetical protein